MLFICNAAPAPRPRQSYAIAPGAGVGRRSGLGAAPPVLPDPESVSGQRRGPPSGAPGPPPPRPRRAASGWKDRLRATLLWLHFGDLLQGNRRCSCPGWDRGAGGPEGEAGAQTPGQPPRAPLPAAGPRAPRPRRRDSSLLRTGKGAGGHRDPQPSPPEAGPTSIWQGLPFTQLRPSLLAPGGGGGRGRGASAGDTAGTAEETSRNWQSRGAVPRRWALPRCLLPRAGARKRRVSAVRGLPGPSLCPRRAEAVSASIPKSGRCWRAGPGRGLSHPRGGNRKDTTVWGFNIQNGGKNARKLYSIFPVKVIILHRTKRKKKAGGPREHRPASDQP